MNITSIINNAINERIKEIPRAYIGASNIGHECSRAIWYDYNQYEKKYDAKTKRTFDIGHRLEALILDYLESTTLKIQRPNSANNMHEVYESEMPEFKGHMDGLILSGNDSVILEIKTMNNTNYRHFFEKGLKRWSPMYYAQVQSYMGMTNFHQSVLIGLNKDSSELHHEWVYFEPDYYGMLKYKAKLIINSDSPPERINRSPIFTLCKKCQFRITCHGISERK